MWARGFNKSGSEGGKQAGYITYRILYKARTLLSSRAIISFSEGTSPSLWSYFLTVPLCKMYVQWRTIYLPIQALRGNRDDVISTVNRLRAGPSGARIPAGAIYFSFLKIVQPGSGVHPVSYLSGYRGSYWGVKAAGAWCWPLTFI